MMDGLGLEDQVQAGWRLHSLQHPWGWHQPALPASLCLLPEPSKCGGVSSLKKLSYQKKRVQQSGIFAWFSFSSLILHLSALRSLLINRDLINSNSFDCYKGQDEGALPPRRAACRSLLLSLHQQISNKQSPAAEPAAAWEAETALCIRFQ